MAQSHNISQPHLVIPIEVPTISESQSPLTFILKNFHVGYFRISLSLSSQALLWKILKEPIHDTHSLRHIFSLMPSTAFTLLWSLSIHTHIPLSPLPPQMLSPLQHGQRRIPQQGWGKLPFYPLDFMPHVT